MSRKQSTLCVVHYRESRKALWLPPEVMKKIKPLKLIIAILVGLAFLAIIILSYCSSTFKLRRLDGNCTGKNTLHLLAFKNAQRIHSSISVRFSDINRHVISNDTFCASFHRPGSANNSLLLSLHCRPFRLHQSFHIIP